ncbi:MAG: hypothetical protein FJ096_13865 [Deltaproteobacteria bacterium]|nr:hypothetical protein [Deltaproteobacteria bacterium]
MRTIFALELCLALDLELLRRLREVVVTPSESISYGEKWQRYSAAAGLLVAGQNLWYRGCWDYWDDDSKARTDFAMWVNGMLTREGSRRAPSGSPDPYRGDARFMTFTMATVMVSGSDCDFQMKRVCTIPQDRLWSRETFAQILRGVNFINFAAVVEDTMYLIPGASDWGLTQEDLSHAKFEYLRQVV